MSHQPEQRTRRSIETLLDAGAQPWENFGADEMKIFGRGFDAESQILLPPVIVSSTGPADGHQRLRLLLSKGHTYISEDDIRVDPTATSENAIERAIAINANRRDTTEAKASLARQLRKERGWSQARIAELFAVPACRVPIVRQNRQREHRRGQSPSCHRGRWQVLQQIRRPRPAQHQAAAVAVAPRGIRVQGPEYRADQVADRALRSAGSTEARQAGGRADEHQRGDRQAARNRGPRRRPSPRR